MATATGATQTTVTYGSNGTPVASPSPMTLTPDGGSGIKTTQTGTVKNPAGNPKSITTTARIPNAAIAGALGRFALRSFAVTSTVMAFGQLLEEIGWNLSEDPDTAGSKYGDPHEAFETVFYFNHQDTTATTWRYSADGRDAACAFRYPGTVGAPEIADLACKYPGAAYVGNINRGSACYQGDGARLPAALWRTQTGYVGTCAEPWVEPKTVQDLIDLIAARSGWPTTSKVAQATAAAAEANGEKVPTPQNPTVTGPAQTQGRKSTSTSTNPDGTTRTESTDCKWNHTYSGAVITSTEACTTTTTNDGVSGKTTTKTETKEGDTAQKTEPPPDPCEGNPTRLGCQELDEPTGEEIPRAQVSLTYAAESPFGGGSCPANKTMELAGQTLTVANWSEWCALTATYVRPLIILLATISAFFIVAMGRDVA